MWVQIFKKASIWKRLQICKKGTNFQVDRQISYLATNLQKNFNFQKKKKIIKFQSKHEYAKKGTNLQTGLKF